MVPKLPHLIKCIANGNGHPGGFVVFNSPQRRGEAERFSTLMIGGPTIVNNSPLHLTRYIEGKLDLVEVAPASSTFGGSPENPADHPVLVQAARKITMPDEMLIWAW